MHTLPSLCAGVCGAAILAPLLCAGVCGAAILAGVAGIIVCETPPGRTGVMGAATPPTFAAVGGRAGVLGAAMRDVMPGRTGVIGTGMTLDTTSSAELSSTRALLRRGPSLTSTNACTLAFFGGGAPRNETPAPTRACFGGAAPIAFFKGTWRLALNTGWELAPAACWWLALNCGWEAVPTNG